MNLDLLVAIISLSGIFIGMIVGFVKYILSKLECIEHVEQKVNILYSILKLHLDNSPSGRQINFGEFDRYFKD